MTVSNPEDKFATLSTEIVTPADEISAQYDRVVDALRAHCGTAVVRLAVEVGRVVILEFFGGEEENFVDRNRYKETRFADFVRERADDLAELGLAERTLRNYVHAFLVWRMLPPQVRELSNVASLQELARLKNPIRRAELAHESTEGRWPVRKLREAVDVELDAEAPPASGKTRKPPAYRWIVKLEKSSRAWSVPADVLPQLSKRDRTNMLNHIANLRGRLDAAEAVLRA